MEENFYYYLHILVIFIIFFSFCLPLYILKYTFVIPFILYLIWVSFNDCPINNLHSKKKKDTKEPVFFIHHLLKKYVDKDITIYKSYDITGLILVSLVTTAAIRFLYKI